MDNLQAVKDAAAKVAEARATLDAALAERDDAIRAAAATRAYRPAAIQQAGGVKSSAYAVIVKTPQPA